MKTTFYTKITTSIMPILLFMLMVPSNVLASPQLFSISSKPFIGVPKDVTPCYVDKAEILLTKLNNEAREDSHFDVNSHINDFDALSTAYGCNYQAEILGIKKLPAIVFDNHYVVYGIDDLPTAKRKYETYKEKHHA